MLYGQDLEFIQNVNIVIENNIFTKISKSPIEFDGDVYEAEGLLIIPGLINAHTHIADSIAKDIASDRGLDIRVNPISGIKRSVLNKSEKEHLVTYMKASSLSMLKRGITSFADFREGGIDGIDLLKKAMWEIDIRCVALGRVEHYFSTESVKNNDELPENVLENAELVIRACDGFGISGANEYSDKALTYFRRMARKQGKLLAIHAAETAETYDHSLKNSGKSEIARIVEHLMPDFIVHMTNATEKDMRMVADKNIGIVVCPRANGVLGAGIPKVASMIKHGCRVAIGTDNVMLNSPDLFRELDYLWKVTRALERNFMNAKELLRMVTVNAAHMLRLDRLGCIAENMIADAIILDMHSIDIEPMHDPYAAIVQRTTESSIRAVISGGKFLSGSI
ncbi:MAG: amidohydrolase family protein [Nitrososphaerales archaeon]